MVIRTDMKERDPAYSGMLYVETCHTYYILLLC